MTRGADLHAEKKYEAAQKDLEEASGAEEDELLADENGSRSRSGRASNEDADVSETLAKADKGAAGRASSTPRTKATTTTSSSRSASTPAASAAPVAEPADDAAKLDSVYNTAGASGTGVTGGTAPNTGNAMQSRVAATPQDYNFGWFHVYADVEPVYARAAAAEVAGDWAKAVEAYRPLWADARVDVAQDAAWRGARALWAQGRANEALSVVDAGLRRGSATTVFRVHLLLLRGDLLNAMARPTEAQRAWDDAAETNQER